MRTSRSKEDEKDEVWLWKRKKSLNKLLESIWSWHYWLKETELYKMQLDISANFEINKQKTISSEQVLKQVIKCLG